MAYCGQKGMVTEQVRGINDFDRFYKNVSDICFDESEDFSRLLSVLTDGGNLYGSRIVFCVLHKIDENILRITEELDKAGVLVVFYVVTDENIENFVRQSTERCKVIAVSSDAKLEGTL